MKLAVILVVISIVVAISARPDDEKYSTKYDNLDVDAIIKSDRLLRGYVDCLLGGKCTKEGEALKEVLPDALKTKCAKCSDIQRENAKKLVHYMTENKKDWWQELEAVYDADGTYKKQYEKDMQEAGIQA